MFSTIRRLAVAIQRKAKEIYRVAANLKQIAYFSIIYRHKKL